MLGLVLMLSGLASFCYSFLPSTVHPNDLNDGNDDRIIFASCFCLCERMDAFSCMYITL